MCITKFIIYIFFIIFIKYNNVTFTTSSISLTNSYFTNIHFNANLGSNIISPDNEKFDLNQDEDFSISFNVVPQAISTPEVGDYVEGGYVFHVSGGYAYVVASEHYSRLYQQLLYQELTTQITQILYLLFLMVVKQEVQIT